MRLEIDELALLFEAADRAETDLSSIELPLEYSEVLNSLDAPSGEIGNYRELLA